MSEVGAGRMLTPPVLLPARSVTFSKFRKVPVGRSGMLCERVEPLENTPPWGTLLLIPKVPGATSAPPSASDVAALEAPDWRLAQNVVISMHRSAFAAI